MELELKQEHYPCYIAHDAVENTHEENVEATVPEHCMDVGRIVDAGACLLIRSHELGAGRLSAECALRVSVLYLAEEAPGLRSFELTQPFTQELELPGGVCDAALSGGVCACEVRLIHPRKIALRATVSLTAKPYSRGVLTVCPEAPEGFGIESQTASCDAALITAIREKDFLFADSIALHASRRPIAELLLSRVSARVTDCAVTGSKISVKGVASVEALYRSEDGEICPIRDQLPFSQLIEGLEGGEGVTAEPVLHLTGCEILPQEDAQGLNVKLFLHAFAALRRRERITCVTDLYSTTHELRDGIGTVTLPLQPEQTAQTRLLREQLDTDVAARSAVDASVAVCCEQGKLSALLRALYLDENGAPLSVRHRVELPLEGAWDGETAVFVDDVSASVNGSGVEVRASLELTATRTPTVELPCLNALAAEPRHTCGGPALVLRPLKEGETLWSLAKRHRTTVDTILRANELESEADAAAGRMLLIPCGR